LIFILIKIQVIITCVKNCVNKNILIDDFRAICGVRGWIFEISSIEFEAVQRFFCNEVLQKIASGIKSKIEPHGELDDESKVEFEVNKKGILKSNQAKISYSSKKIKVLLTKIIKTQLTGITHSSKKIKALLTKIIKTQLTMFPHSSKMVKTQLTKKIVTLFTKSIKNLLTKMIKSRSIPFHTQSNMSHQ
jgi:hypothetical protein